MSGLYLPQSWYYIRTRLMLQDEIAPYRYTDDTLAYCLNSCIREMSRLRSDVFLDLKYQRPIRNGDIGTGFDNLEFTLDPPDSTMPTGATDTLMPIPEQYQQAIIWGATGMAQFLDVTDTQDQRAQGFLQKFQMHLATLTGA